jgi:hypothetical protein
MAPGRCITARPAQWNTPDWRPLEQVLDGDLLGGFMWMCELRTPAGGAIHCYKHVDTRRSIHLDASETAFVYLGDDRYRSVPLAAALEEVFASWAQLGAFPAQVAAVQAAIDGAQG